MPAIRRNASLISIGLSLEFLWSGIEEQAKKAFIGKIKILLMILANVLHRAIDLLPTGFDVNIHFRLVASIPEGPVPPCVFIADICIFFLAIPSNLTRWIHSGLSTSSTSWYTSFPSGCFNCHWVNI